MADGILDRDGLGGLGPQIGEGGQARVFHAPGLTLPDAPGPLVVKEYKPGCAPPAGLRRLVAFRAGLDPDRRDRLDQLAAWPLRVVRDGDRTVGVVLPLIPDTFFQDRVLPGTGRRDLAPREVQNLLIPPARARQVGMPTPTVEQRLVICRDFAAALHFVHQHQLVVGDLNARNALFRTTGRPAVILVDCDAIRVRGRVASQLNAPDWEPPEAQLTQSSDCYKFGLFVLRCLSTGEQRSTTRDPDRADAALDEEGRRLLRATLRAVPAERPTAWDWGSYLQFRLTGRRLPPRPASPVRATGTVATTGWVRDPVTGRWTPGRAGP
ncbi:protein kinase [Micromonospora sp. WMMD882]|uniref:protein kinase n=1 Tax=Micromonospora sp. WMMD882 TaxID=3015151 RepID=UPI00248B363D|nr:protein kinase [Micromonospora sp. WMMD882]WBB80603.1 protein kinase [Micromonospora sp. WMMD882]